MAEMYGALLQAVSVLGQRAVREGNSRQLGRRCVVLFMPCLEGMLAGPPKRMLEHLLAVVHSMQHLLAVVHSMQQYH